MKFYTSLSLFLGVFALLAGCNSYRSKLSPLPEENISAASIDYAFVRAQVFEPYCVRCHSSAGGDKGDVNLETYDNVITHLEDIRIDVFEEQKMPPKKARGAFGDREKNILKQWLDRGAPLDVKPEDQGNNDEI